ncbi:MAG: glycosyltransferase family 2 protein [Elusimicrobia bacterium]|nr:glycosyltransferase family 2 protein [Candidatus Obscuribacterium magneticum]
MTEKPYLSIIIPIFNEEGNLTSLIQSLLKACAAYAHEIIAINDGSTDGSAEELGALAKITPSLRILSLKRNFGQTAALAAGIDHAQGDIIVPLDGDGQNDPEDIPRLIEKLKEGYDVVSGWRKNRQDNFLSRRLPSYVANALISRVTGVPLHDYGCTLKAYRRSIIAHIQLAGEMHRFLPAWCVWQGGKVTEMVVNHHPRKKGKSKYGLLRFLKVIIDLITVKFFSGYLAKPNYIFSGMGLFFFLLGFSAAAIAFIDKFGPDLYPQYRTPLLLLAIFFSLVAVFLILMGLLAELLVRLYFHVSHQKPYRLTNE